MRDVLQSIGNRWSYLILLALAERPRRFGEFRAEIEGISQRSLTEALRRLRRDGFVERDRFSIAPPIVGYRLTRLGESLVATVRDLRSWATEHESAIVRSRATFDAAADRSRLPQE